MTPRSSHLTRILPGSVVLIVLGLPLSATVRIGTFDATRAFEANLKNGALAGHIQDALRRELGEDFKILPTGELTAEFLADIDLLFVHNASGLQSPIDGPLTELEAVALKEFVLSGGKALILVDGAWPESGNTFVAPFDLRLEGFTLGRDAGAVGDANHPIMAGPYGSIASYSTWFAGWFDTLPPGAEPLAMLGDPCALGLPDCEVSKTTFVVFDAGALGPWSGRVAVTTDINPYVPCALDADRYFFCETEPLFLNTLRWLFAAEVFRRGDATGDGTVNLADALFSLNHLFASGPAPSCPDAADANDDGGLNVADGVYTLNYLFSGGKAPPVPGPDNCGVDPTADALPDCEAGESCR